MSHWHWDDYVFAFWMFCMFMLITGIAPIPKNERRRSTTDSR